MMYSTSTVPATGRMLLAAVLAASRLPWGASSAASAAAAPPSWCPSPSAAGTPPRTSSLPRGVLSAVAHFGADPTGRADSTAALGSNFRPVWLKSSRFYPTA